MSDFLPTPRPEATATERVQDFVAAGRLLLAEVRRDNNRTRATSWLIGLCSSDVGETLAPDLREHIRDFGVKRDLVLGGNMFERVHHKNYRAWRDDSRERLFHSSDVYFKKSWLPFAKRGQPVGVELEWTHTNSHWVQSKIGIFNLPEPKIAIQSGFSSLEVSSQNGLETTSRLNPIVGINDLVNIVESIPGIGTQVEVLGENSGNLEMKLTDEYRGYPIDGTFFDGQ